MPEPHSQCATTLNLTDVVPLNQILDHRQDEAVSKRIAGLRIKLTA